MNTIILSSSALQIEHNPPSQRELTLELFADLLSDLCHRLKSVGTIENNNENAYKLPERVFMGASLEKRVQVVMECIEKKMVRRMRERMEKKPRAGVERIEKESKARYFMQMHKYLP